MATALIAKQQLLYIQDNKDTLILQNHKEQDSFLSGQHHHDRRQCLLVLDKDGTLGDCKTTLQRWVKHMTTCIIMNTSSTDGGAGVITTRSPEEVEDDCGVTITTTSATANDHNHDYYANSFYKAIGWDPVTQDVVPSALVAAGTWEEILEVTHALLMKLQSKFETSEDGMMITLETVQGWHQQLRDLHGQDPPLIPDLPGMLSQCQALGYEIAICTSDDRASTMEALRQWKIEKYIRYSICGDEVIEGKPSVVPLQALCAQAGVGVYSPRQCIVVGDTTADTGMARNAQAALCVGVLTGSGTAEQLRETGAHVILPHIGHLPSLLEELATMPELVVEEQRVLSEKQSYQER